MMARRWSGLTAAGALLPVADAVVQRSPGTQVWAVDRREQGLIDVSHMAHVSRTVGLLPEEPLPVSRPTAPATKAALVSHGR